MKIAFDNSYARLPERFYARGEPDAGARRRGSFKLNRALARELGLDPDALAAPEGVGGPGGQTRRRRAPSRSPRPTPGTSSATSCRSSATAARSCSARSSTGTARAATSSSRARGGRPSRAAATGGRRWGRCCASTWSARRWRRSASRRPARWRRWRPGRRCAARELLPGAVLTRVAASHIRVGTFQFFAARGDVDGLRALADHVIARHYPDAAGAERPYRALLDGVIARAGAS